MKPRIVSPAAAGALVCGGLLATALPAAADQVPGEPDRFYAYCSIDVFGFPWSCTETDAGHASHECSYMPCGVDLSLACEAIG
ncbi:hypothetical protein [Amycolatopsis sp. FDAARGOS 1241]|uniref:hypothetical protein n=1 Tax=Amycolatopsis sp. FDAARGOS 1241 TaxID=2778070 RepID=UPI001951270C|nr:hypothetical protein [Amycolatopsis sp. FDAARGOS 1241]QRP48188.1 hypothetical protein I6J71_10085 [Amycolatopsis sp. FDAARGOS 1241]